MKKGWLGLDENIASALTYVFGWISGVVFLLFERDNKTVRFHAMQSTIWFAFASIVGFVLKLVMGLIAIIPLLGGFVSGIVLWVWGVFTFASWAFLIFKAYKGGEFRIPFIGDAAHDAVFK